MLVGKNKISNNNIDLVREKDYFHNWIFRDSGKRFKVSFCGVSHGSLGIE